MPQSDALHGFELLRDEQIPELNTRARLLRHRATGAELLSLENDDENKTFGVTFRTPVDDNTGVAHILEHTVLCGSRKYPIKDPFVQLIKGSLQTFVNAFTYPDKTCYPVASQNLKDFYNLVDVYLDAVFFPRLAEYHFQQEGWHYELDAPDAPLRYKGVVFNEMKGSRASADRMMYVNGQQVLFPDTIYRVDSGGDPAHMIDLTYDQFTNFHHTYYHPSNARLFFYGDDDPTERLRLVAAYLDQFERQEPRSQIPLQQRWDAPQSFTRHYPAGEQDADRNAAMLTVGWLLRDPEDATTAMALDILEYILLGTNASPLRKALIDSGLGEDVTGAGLMADIRQWYFSVGLKGIAESSAPDVAALVIGTLERLANDGIDPQTVEAALNTVEFSLRENNTGSFPRGISLMLRALRTWLYDGDPYEPLAFEGPLAAVKAAAAETGYFEGLIRRFILDNPHRATLLLLPDSTQTAQEQEAEQRRLEREYAAMDTETRQTIYEHTLDLKRMQETPDDPADVARLPSLARGDLDRTNKPIPTSKEDVAGVPVLFHDLFTNGILYVDLGMNLHTLPPELVPYVPLFSRALTELGTAAEDDVRLSQRIGRHTGGIRATTLTSAVYGAPQGVAWLFLRAKAVPAQASELLAILRDILLTVRLDNRERFRQIVLEEKAGLESSLTPSGHGYVNRRLRAGYTDVDWASEQMGGIDHLFFLRELAGQVENDWASVQATLEQVRDTLVNRSASMVNLTATASEWADFRPQLATFLEALPQHHAAEQAWPTGTPTSAEALTIPAKVNYVGKAANLFELGYTPHGSAIVISRYLRTTYLWEKIRVQGGAYGGFSVYDRHSGVFSFLSYRDPNLLQTLNVYDQAGQFLRQIDMTDEELTRAIIGAISDIDSYQLPDAKGYTALVRYLVGDTDERRQQMRDEVLGTGIADFHAFGAMLGRVSEAGRVAVLGGSDAIEAAQQERGGFTVTAVL